MDIGTYKTNLGYDIIKAAIHGKLNGELNPLFQLDPASFDKIAFQEIFVEARAMYDAKQPITTAALCHGLGARLKGRPLLEPIIGLLVEMESEKHEGEYLAGHLDSILARFQKSQGIIEAAGETKPAEERRAKPLADEVREWVLSSTGVFLSSDVVKCLQVSSRDGKKNLSKILTRLVGEGLIERHGDRNGCYRRIERNYETLDIVNAVTMPFGLILPFEIHKKVHVLQKSIIVAAGEVNAGKTAFALNVAKLNMDNLQVRYLSSEMGASEIKTRLLKVDIPLERWKKVEFIERSNTFHDLVLPDGLTVIDFLEKNDNFYEIGQDIKNIFDKLKTGVAFILIQKKAGQIYGRGGDFSAEKARLYLSMEPGKIRIVKGKNWANPDVNPNGLELGFKLVDGYKFIETSGWRKSEN